VNSLVTFAVAADVGDRVVAAAVGADVEPRIFCVGDAVSTKVFCELEGDGVVKEPVDGESEESREKDEVGLSVLLISSRVGKKVAS
jgi:hypothetical protein